MTGFGRGRAESSALSVQVDLRSVNHRFLDLRPRLPFFSPELEARLKELVSSRLRRGKVDLLLQVEEKGEGLGGGLKVDRHLLRDWMELLQDLKQELDLEGRPSLDHIASLPWGKVFEVREMQVTEDVLPVFEEAMERALDQMVEMRRREGKAIRADMLGHLDALEALIAEIAEEAADLVPLYRDRLQERIRALVQDGSLDDDKLLQEAAYLADRSDISEEVARLRGHADELRGALDAEGAVGKKIDFLLQECHREVNTIGSKAKGADLGREVVDAKAHVEAMREQAQNIE